MKKSGLHFCNILQAGAEARQLWRFHLGNNRVDLASEQHLPADQPLPPKLVAKDWRSLFWKKGVNIAWLPADQVFLRVIHLPPADRKELASMVELQLERLSPLPVHQIVWSFESFPPNAENLQTVIVVIAARSEVESFLGTLETAGYLPDRLELPQLQQLLATPVEGDGVWIYPPADSKTNLCVAAWWYGGALRHLQLLHLPADSESQSLILEQLNQTAWAGEMEGWLTSPPRWRLVANAQAAERWKPLLKDAAADTVQVQEPLSDKELAEFNARRATKLDPGANLIPPERSVRYHQQFVDRLWMNGLGAVIGIYLVGVLIYFAALQVLKYQHHRVETELAGLKTSYTNAVKLSEHIKVLQNQLNLKFAALDCFKAASDLLPAELVLTKLDFRGDQRRLVLDGHAPLGENVKITDYNDDLRKATANGQLLFSRVDPPKVSTRGQNLTWSFMCELNLPGD